MIVVPGLTHTHIPLCGPLTKIYIMRVTEGGLDFFNNQIIVHLHYFFLDNDLNQAGKEILSG